MDIQQILNGCQWFQWDQGNDLKSWLKHHVSKSEAEQVFFNEPLLLVVDQGHSHQEARFRGLGYTDERRFLFIVFTIREDFVRIISVRDMNKKEKVDYEKFKAGA